MKTLIVTDIYGETPELGQLAHSFCSNPIVVSPYCGADPGFYDEEAAYRSFLDYGGIDAYTKKLLNALSSCAPDALVGFSAGATAAWIALSRPHRISVQLGVLFYASRIRDHLKAAPGCKTQLIFAEHEKRVDSKRLVEALNQQGIAAEIIPDSMHGFMNRRSPGYDPVLMRKGAEFVKQALAGIRSDSHPLP